MNPISTAAHNPSMASPALESLPGELAPDKRQSKVDEPKPAHVAQQFEAILMRQFLSESMKPLLEGGPSGQVYGYLITDSLSETLAAGGGMGLAHILQAQLSK